MSDPMTDNAQAEMVGRLRAKGQTQPTFGSGSVKVDANGRFLSATLEISDDGARLINPNGPEAADALERMAGEMAALREALRPFAKLADFLDEQPDPRWQNPHDEFQCGDFAYSIGVGEVQIARQALATSMAQGQGGED